MLKKIYYQGRLKLYQNDTRNTWKVTKEVIVKTKKKRNYTFPENIIIDKIDINEKKIIA